MPTPSIQRTRSGRALTIFAVCSALLSGCADDAPTTVLLRIEEGSLTQTPKSLRLSVYGDAGQLIDNTPLPATGALELPGEVVLYPRQQSGTLRLLVRAFDARDTEVGSGLRNVTLQSGQQTRATIMLEAGSRPDRDGDGVPDEIDNCPDVSNPQQEPCAMDGSADVGDASDGGPQEGGVDARRDVLAPDTVDCDKDGDKFLAVACGGNDCDDDDAAVHPGATEGPFGSAICADGKDNDCDGNKDGADNGCQQCTSATQCDDKNPCTNDACTGGLCENLVQLNRSCDDGDPCTAASKCLTSGGCGGGTAVGCAQPANPCKAASCISAQGGCVTQNAANGTPCDDGDPCTAATCQSGTCTAPNTTYCVIGGACVAEGSTQDGCVCDPTRSTTAWSPPVGGCKIGSQCYTSNAVDSAGSGCTCLGAVDATDWSPKATECKIAGRCVGSGTDVPCGMCNPASSQTSYTTIAGCNNAIVLVALNNGYQANLGGIAGADALCQAEATKLGITKTVPAMLASSARDLIDLVPLADRNKKVVNGLGTTIYPAWNAAFVGASQQTDIFAFDGKEVDENMGAVPEWKDAAAWTGSGPDGLWAGAANDCAGWTSTVGDGASGEVDVHGLFNKLDTRPCSNYQAVICVWVH